MPVSRLSVENYRCFARPQPVEIRPITVLIGRNNAGKSAFARAPLLLESAVRGEGREPIVLDAGLARESSRSFVDLIHANRLHGSIRFQFTIDDAGLPPIDVDVTVQNISEERAQLVSHFSLKTGSAECNLEWMPDESVGGQRPYLINESSASDAAYVDFLGVLPESLPEAAGDDAYRVEIQRALDRVRRNFDHTRYLGPFRQEPEPFYAFPQRAPDVVGIRGEHAPGILAVDALASGAPILKAVNTYLSSSATEAWELTVDRDTGLNNLFSLSLVARFDADLKVNLADTGTGIAQALPIFVQRALDGIRSPAVATLEVIEQPELHLHPAAHADLADLYVSAVASTPCRYLVETHSETFLLRLRRRVAEGLDPTTVGFYFVDHDGLAGTVNPIPIDEFGNVTGWPEGIFTEDYAESKALVHEQLRRAGNGDQH